MRGGASISTRDCSTRFVPRERAVKYLVLVLAGLRRHRSRSLLTLASILAAFLLFGFLDGVRTVFGAGTDTYGLDRLIVTSRLSLIQPLPLSQLARILALDGVAAAAHANWFGGVYQDRRNFFPNIAVSPASWLATHPEIGLGAAEREAFLTTRAGALVGEDLAARFGWRIGDRLPLEGTIFPHRNGSNTWTFEVVGIMRATDEERAAFAGELLFRYDYFDEGRTQGQGTVGWYVVQLTDPARSNEVAQAIDALFRNSDAETKTQSEQAFNLAFAKQFGDIGLIVSAIMAAVFFTVLLVTANTMAQGVRERVGDIAILKTLGFRDGTVCALVVAEALALLLAGGCAGLGLAALALPTLSRSLRGQLPPLAVGVDTWLLGLAIMLGLGLAVGLPPALGALRLKIVDALARR